MTIRTLLFAAIRKQKANLAGLLALMLVCVISLSLALTVYANSSAVIRNEMERLGYGTFTAWVSGEGYEALVSELVAQEDIEAVRVQPLVFSGYLINGAHSDTEGELIPWQKDEYDYRFFNDSLDGYKTVTEIASGEIYLSPAMKSSFGAEIGDEIRFELSRENAGRVFTVAGFFEDPFMGGSMVDMKSFLISEEDFASVIEELEGTSGFNILGRKGAMLHIFQAGASGKTITGLNRLLNENTSLGQYSEMMYSEDTIFGFMLLLQNILTGFLLAFSGLLAVVAVIVLASSVKNTLEQERADIGILKTVGLNGAKLRAVLVLQYWLPAILASVLGVLLTVPAAHAARSLTVASTGMLISSALPAGSIGIACLGLLLMLFLFVLSVTAPLLSLRPLQAITARDEPEPDFIGKNPVKKRTLGLSLAIRQIITGSKRYASVFIVTAILTVFAAVVGRMNSWVGPQGEGLMNSFSVAEHDIGFQPTTQRLDMAEVQALIETYSPITDEYRIAMRNGSVNGVDYTVNVLDKPEWFHVLSGRAAMEADELLITEYVAKDLGVGIGDTVSVSADGGHADYQVVGIYECANSMGANVGMSEAGYARLGNTAASIWCHHYILRDGELRSAVLDELTARYRLEADIHDNSWTGLGGIVSVLHLVIALMYAVTAFIICVVVALSGKRALIAEQRELAIYKSVGFGASRLRLSFALRFGVTAALGAVLGTVIAALGADALVSAILKNFGIGGFSSSAGAGSALLPAAAIILLSFACAWLYAQRIKTVSVKALIDSN